MGFKGDLMGFKGDLMGFKVDLIVISLDLQSLIMVHKSDKWWSIINNYGGVTIG